MLQGSSVSGQSEIHQPTVRAASNSKRLEFPGIAEPRQEDGDLTGAPLAPYSTFPMVQHSEPGPPMPF